MGPGGIGRGTRRGSAAYVDALSSPGDDVETATKQTFARLGELLQQAQMGWRDVALVTVYVSDIADMPKMNAVFAETFPKDPPARITIQVQPQANERVRIGVIAAQ
jgi:2-iminobutanoate/2-iminopropanoate deaminase